MSRLRRVLAAAAAALALASASVRAQGVPKSSRRSSRLASSPTPTASSPAQPFRLAVVAEIRPGWHVNSHTPKEDFLIPTEVKVKPAPGLTLRRSRTRRTSRRKFAFSDQKLAVYEGRTVFVIPATADAGAAPGPRTLTAVLSYQPCNDNQCLPPADLTATLAIDVAKAGTDAKPANADVFAPPPSGGGAARRALRLARPLAADTAPEPGRPRNRGSAREVEHRRASRRSFSWAPTAGRPAARVVGFEPPERFARARAGRRRRDAGRPRRQVAPAPPRPRLPLGPRAEPDPVRLPADPDHARLLQPAERRQDGRDVRPRARLRPRNERHVLGPRRLRGPVGLALRRVAPEARGPRRESPRSSSRSRSRCSGSTRSRPRTSSRTGRARSRASLGALTMGLFVGFVAAPCIGPFVLSLLTYVAAKGSAPLGLRPLLHARDGSRPPVPRPRDRLGQPRRRSRARASG